MEKEPTPVGNMLRESADTFDQRNALYGDNYKRFGPIVDALFPAGVHLCGPDDFRRFGVLVQVISKLSRYCANFAAGGHDDSLLDLSTYSAMLRELDHERKIKHEKDLAEVVGQLSGRVFYGGKTATPPPFPDVPF